MDNNNIGGVVASMRQLSINAAAVLTVAITLAACSSVQNVPLSQDFSNQLSGKKIALTKYPTPDFVPFNAVGAAFSLIGAVAMRAEGKNIVKDNALEDPALKLSQDLLETLRKERGVIPFDGQNVTADSDDISTLVTTYPQADYLLDVKTRAWWFHYYANNWTHYRVSYSARLRLINVATKEVVAEGPCVSTQGDDQNPPTKTELLEHNAFLLKAYLAKAEAACTNFFAATTLKLPVAANHNATFPDLQTGAELTLPFAGGQRPGAQISAASDAADAQQWRGVMTCGERMDQNANHAGYKNVFTGEVRGVSVNLHHENNQSIQSMSGRIRNNVLDLRGGGSRKNVSNSKWDLRIQGDFLEHATIFSGKGGLYSNGKMVRACDFTMAPVTSTQ